MKKKSKTNVRIVAWPFAGTTAIGAVDQDGYVIVAMNYKMDSNMGEKDLWYADELYTDDIPEQDWSKVRMANEEERDKFLALVGYTKLFDKTGSIILDNLLKRK